MVEITPDRIDTQQIISRAADPGAGGMNIFIGTIRDFNHLKGKKVIRLEYEAYEPMAVSTIQEIAAEATKTYGIRKWAVAHRTGILTPGEVAVVVAVATAHRKESFQACEYIIDQLKVRVPIWKKEILE